MAPAKYDVWEASLDPPAEQTGSTHEGVDIGTSFSLGLSTPGVVERPEIAAGRGKLYDPAARHGTMLHLPVAGRVFALLKVPGLLGQ